MMPCVPDCPETPFQRVYLTTELTINGCVVEVGYRYRKACNQYYDLFIDLITTVNGRNEANDPACDALFSRNSSAAILAEVTRALMLRNPMGFPPNEPGECEVNWRVVKGGCWSRPYINFGSLDRQPSWFVNRLVPCPTEEVCCLDYFKVCVDEYGRRVITSQPPPKSNKIPSCWQVKEDKDEYGTTYRSCDPVCGVAPALWPFGDE